MIALGKSGRYSRGEMNEEGIYVTAGDVKIYDMKYYNYPEHKIKFLQSFPHSYDVNSVTECFFKNSITAMCCDMDGYIKEFNLSNPHFIPTPTIFNKTTGDLRRLYSCMVTKDKKYIIAAGGEYKLYFFDVEDGTLTYTLHYETNGEEYDHAYQIAEVRPNILVTADAWRVSLHDIGDIQNIPTSIKLPRVGSYYSVIALESNPGDFAIGGVTSSSPYLGFVYIYHLEDNQTITTLKYVDNIIGTNCVIVVIKELKRGTIIFGGDSDCYEMCLWNYATIPNKDPLCWDDQTDSHIIDIVGVPY